MAKVIEFYIPKSFRKPSRTAAEPQLGKVITFCPTDEEIGLAAIRLPTATDEELASIAVSLLTVSSLAKRSGFAEPRWD
jgi:hypothetical protein